MRCRSARKTRLLGKESRGTSVRRKRHMNQCPDCTRWNETLQRLEEDVRKTSPLHAPENMLEEIWPSVRERLSNAPVTSGRRIPGHSRLAVAWSVPILAVGILLLILIPRLDSGRSNLSSFPVNVMVESAEIDGQDAQIAIVERNDPAMTFIWMEKSL